MQWWRCPAEMDDVESTATDAVARDTACRIVPRQNLRQAANAKVNSSSSCGKRGHGSWDCWTKQQHDENNGGERGGASYVDRVGMNRYHESEQQGSNFGFRHLRDGRRGGSRRVRLQGGSVELHRREFRVTRRGRITVVDSGAAETVMARQVPVTDKRVGWPHRA